MTEDLQRWARLALSLDGLLWLYAASVVGIYWTTKVRMKLWIPMLVLLGSLITFVVAATRPFTGFNDSAPLIMMGAILMAAASMAVLYVGWFQQQLANKKGAPPPPPRRTELTPRPKREEEALGDSQSSRSGADLGPSPALREAHWAAARLPASSGAPLSPWGG